MVTLIGMFKVGHEESIGLLFNKTSDGLLEYNFRVHFLNNLAALGNMRVKEAVLILQDNSGQWWTSRALPALYGFQKLLYASICNISISQIRSKAFFDR